MKTESYEFVKNRMIKKAAAIWGVPANEIDTSFDPIVSLLLAACASEIVKIEGELNESQNIITEKLIQLMTPEAIFGSKPSHAVLHANTIDSTVTVKPEYLFYYKKKITHKNASLRLKNIFFSPVQDFKLMNGSIKYLVSGDSFKELNSNKEQKIISKKNISTSLPPSTLYLGIESNLKHLPLKDLSAYFELEDIDNKDLFYHYLKYSEWYINDKKIKCISGFSNDEESSKIDLDAVFGDVSSKSHNINEFTLDYYKKHYVTLKSPDKKIKKSSYKEIEDFALASDVDLGSNVTWIKIVFPRIINNSTLQKVFCSLNAFPVLNRELKSFSYQMRNFINILPISTEDYFLDIKSIVNTNGKVYKPKRKNVTGTGKGTYMVRGNNIGKLDHRSAKEYLSHLIELLKDESASFSFLNNDFLHSNLNSLNQHISLLENKVSTSNDNFSETNYVVVEPFNKKENLLIEYWATNGEDANDIKSGSHIDVYKAIGIKQKGSYLLTTTFDGKNDLTLEERLNSYRRSLLSRDRIVTKEDIKALCYELYNDKIKKVEIKRSYTNNVDINKGITQCIEIVLTSNEDVVVEENQWDSLNSNLLLFLEKKSINIFPYKIKIVN